MQAYLKCGKILSLALLLLGSTLPIYAQKLNLPPIVRAQEPNGIKTALMEYRKTPTLSLRAVFPFGTANDPADKAGVADILTTLMMRGTTSQSALQISEAIDFLGGSLSVTAGRESITVSLEVLAKDLDAGLDLFADVIRNATLPEGELDRERQLAIAGLQSLGEEPRAVAAVVLMETIYKGHPYGASQTITSLKNITRQDLQDFYHRAITPNNMLLVGVGDFKVASLQQKLRAKFGDWAKTDDTLPPVPTYQPIAKSLLLIDKPDATQTQVRLVRPALPIHHPDHYASELANAILGGGFTSRLTEEIRINRSLTYSINSGFQKNLKGGSFQFSSFTKVETTGEMLKALRDLLKKTATEGFSETEVRKTKGYMAGLFAIGAQTPQALAGQLVNQIRNNLPDNYLATYIEKIQAVSLADVNRIAKTYFQPNALSFVLVAPASKIKDQIKPFGVFEVKPVDSVGK